MNTMLDNIYIVLVSPDESSNIGAVCRAMKTMGLSKLRIVNPGNYDENKIRYVSVHAFDIYQNRSEYKNLTDAVSDLSFAAAATRRKGKKRKYSCFTPEEAADFVLEKNPGKSAFVFGNEEHGLTDSELSGCTISVCIPSSPSFPSLNLSHAVQLVAYTIFRRHLSAERNGGSHEQKLDINSVSSLASGITSNLERAGFFKLTDDTDIRIFLRDIFSRAALNAAEGEKILNIFRKISGIATSGKNTGKPGSID